MKRIWVFEIVNRKTGEIVYFGHDEKQAKLMFKVWNKTNQYLLRKGIGWRA